MRVRHRRLIPFPGSTSRSARILALASLLCWASTGIVRGQVSGVVLDAVTRQPIADAQVKVQAVPVTTRTAADGTFSLTEASGVDLWIVAAQVYYYESPVRVTTPATGVEILMEAVPQGTNPNYSFVTPSACGICHPDQYEQWNGSAMALPGGNTWVYDLYDGTGTAGGTNGFVYTRDSEHRTMNPNSECASCHQPESWVKQPFRPLDPIGNLSQNAKRGVSCEVCHKIAHVDETQINYPGIYPDAVTFTLPENGTPYQVSYGVFGDVDFSEPYIMRASWQPQVASTMCGACHQDKNDPDDDGDFEEANGVVSEPTYLEWKDGPFGQEDSPYYTECVGCHMPSFGATYCAEGVMDPEPTERDPDTIRHHGLEATQTMVDWAADLTLTAEIVGGSLNASVVVSNSGAGHYLPTGSSMRNMILYVRAWRIEDGLPLTFTGSQTIHELGGVGSPSQGYYGGQPGKLFARVLEDPLGAHPVLFTEATGVLFDTRLAPLASDTTAYSFDLPGGFGTYALQARLLYRRAFRELVDVKGWTETGHGAPLEDLEAPYYGHLMAKTTWPNETVDVLGSITGDPALRLAIAPNPIISSAEISFNLPRAERVRLDVYDLSGRVVANLIDRELPAGPFALEWHPIDAEGFALSAGVYWCGAEANGQRTASSRLLVIR